MASNWSRWTDHEPHEPQMIEDTAYIVWSPNYAREGDFGRTPEAAWERLLASMPDSVTQPGMERAGWRCDPFQPTGAAAATT